MENLKKNILSKIPQYDSEKIDWYDFSEFENLIYEENGYRIYSDALQKALDTYKCIKISKREAMYLKKPIILKSGYRLLLDEKQVVANVPGTLTCLIRNENLVNGDIKPAFIKNPDTDISVDGGIWDGGITKKDEALRLRTGETPDYKGSLSIMIFINVENLVVRNAEYRNGGVSYALQLGCVNRFHISKLKFIKYGRDGVHVNGPASFGEICNLHGEDMGDDMVALNAWDWDTSAITFGTIENLYVHDNKSTNNELRLLPGQKVYENDKTDCDIRNCVLERLEGIYTFKLYCQPNIFNAIYKGYNDTSGTVGNIYDVYFKNIKINENRESGFNDLPVNGVFDVCANCHNLYFEDIEVSYTKKELENRNLSFMSVGPLSAVWTNGSDNPEDWGEVFAPDSVCHVEDIYFKNIFFKDAKADKKEDLVKEIKLEINHDYPNTKPKGGTGYGTIGKIFIEE